MYWQNGFLNYIYFCILVHIFQAPKSIKIIFNCNYLMLKQHCMKENCIWRKNCIKVLFIPSILLGFHARTLNFHFIYNNIIIITFYLQSKFKINIIPWNICLLLGLSNCYSFALSLWKDSTRDCKSFLLINFQILFLRICCTVLELSCSVGCSFLNFSVFPWIQLL